MADAFVGTTGNASVFHVTSLDLRTRWFMERSRVFRRAVTEHPVAPDHNYKSVMITIEGELAPDLTIPSETVTPDSVDIPATRQVTVTMDEHMKVYKHTFLGDATSWNGNLPADLVRSLMQWTADSVDLSVRTALDAATKVFYITTGGVLQAADPGDATRGNMSVKAVAGARAQLKSRRASYFNGQRYMAIIHPDVAFDLFIEGGPGGGTWSVNSKDAPGDQLENGFITSYASVDFLESEQCTVATPTADKVYTSYFLGRDGVIELVKKEPTVAEGPVIDPARRIIPVVSHGLYGHAILRNNPIQLVKTESSIGALYVDQSTFDPKL